MGYQHRDCEIPDHMTGAIGRYIEHGILPGSFLTAVLENNLIEAVGRADSVNVHELPAYVGYLYNEAPADCYGSKELVSAWVSKKAFDRLCKAELDEGKNLAANDSE